MRPLGRKMTSFREPSRVCARFLQRLWDKGGEVTRAPLATSDRTRDRTTSCAAGLPSARRCSPWLPALLPFPCSHFWQVRPSVPLRHPWPPHTQRRNRKRASRLTWLSCRCDCSDAGAPYRCLRPAHRAEDAQDGLGAAWWHRHRDARPRPSPPKGRKEHHLEDSSFRARALQRPHRDCL